MWTVLPSTFVTASTLGPDLVIAGAARSGTSALAAQLGTHPDIDPSSVKESNYFSRELGRGSDWYDSLYAERRTGLLRMDASTSYTSTLYPDALARLAEAAPDALVVYVVRHPTERALSHYLFRRHHFRHEKASDFGAALRSTSRYVDASDYSHWTCELRMRYPDEQILVVPFELVAASPLEVTGEICRILGIAAPTPASRQARRHRNDVVEYRSEVIRRGVVALRKSAFHPRLRAVVGAGRVRKARGLLTRKPVLPSTDEAMASCTAEQLQMLKRLDEQAGAAVRDHLIQQDARLGLAWEARSFVAAGG